MKSPPPKVILVTIVVGLLLWGGMLALGATLNDENTGMGLIKGLLVGGCTLGFLGFWGAMLWLHRRPKTSDDQLPDHDQKS